MNELISIIMPAYNAEKFIKQAIESIILQTYKNWELLVVDDGSTDETSSIIKELVKNDNRIQYFFQQNSKQGKARNLGVENSNGRLIAFLDADDVWLSKRLEILIEHFDENKYDLIFSDAYVFTNVINTNSIPNTQERFNVSDQDYFGESALKDFLIYNRIPLLTILVKKQILRDSGMFSDRGICEDYEMWLRLLINGYRFKSISIPLAAYRVHKNSTTVNDKLAIDECIDVLNDLSKVVSAEYKILFLKSLKIWYVRKLSQISNYTEFNKFLKKMLAQGNYNLSLRIISKMNFAFLYSINKYIINNSLK
ncbi:MAG: glycosyltransferase [Pedobacter sp.]|nr:MAG: glycosyltransferase [Pedobacter sp.]